MAASRPAAQTMKRSTGAALSAALSAQHLSAQLWQPAKVGRRGLGGPAPNTISVDDKEERRSSFSVTASFRK